MSRCGLALLDGQGSAAWGAAREIIMASCVMTVGLDLSPSHPVPSRPGPAPSRPIPTHPAIPMGIPIGIPMGIPMGLPMAIPVGILTGIP